MSRTSSLKTRVRKLAGILCRWPAAVRYVYLRFFVQRALLRRLRSQACCHDGPSLAIAISTNDVFLEQAQAMAASLENALCEIDLYVVNVSLSAEEVRAIAQAAADNVRVHEVTVPPERLSELAVTDKWPLEAWARVLVPELVDEETVLYLDVDVIVTGSLRGLAGCGSSAAIAGVRSPYYHHVGEFVPGDTGPVNSGVLVMNKRRLLQEGFPERVMAYAKRNAASLVMPDQDSINAVAGASLCNVALKYNVMNVLFSHTYSSLCRYAGRAFCRRFEFREAVFSPAIVHFNGGPFARPWDACGMRHPYAGLYDWYRRKSMRNIAERARREETV